ncbi:MAG: aminotransferase class V-fold PLP-dependent enzyme [Actinobacteria bacterium]|nr:aminotransferase class V-fold PLP-dependent enzyme [Actinomycetota bacterium]
MSDTEIAAARAVTPGCDSELGIVHLNHAGCSLPPQAVLDAEINHLRRESMIGGYEAADEAGDRSAAVYASIARLIGAQSHEIARVEHATAGWNAAFWSVPMEAGQRILVHDHEYGANAVAFIRAAETRGVVIDLVPSDSTGQVSVEAVEERLSLGDVALVSLTHIPTNGGLVNPAIEIGSLARSAGVPYLVDGCQSIGQRDIDVQEIGCDFYSAAGRKFLRGPRGTGFLYVRDSILDRVAPAHPDHWGASLTKSAENPEILRKSNAMCSDSATFPEGWADRFEWMPGARRYENFEHSVAGWLGLGAAADCALEWGTDRIEVTVSNRAEELRSMLTEIGLEVHDQGEVRSGIVTTTSDRVPSVELRRALSASGVNTSTTSFASSPYDSLRRDLPPLLRISVQYTTTVEELTFALDVLRTFI